ncbi:MAG: sulfatase [Chloroflexi bacterium]|nr:sulfatase [Chloroflexota bacterium]
MVNIIVVVNDSLRVDQLGCYQSVSPNSLNTRIETPNVDAFAREAALFENAYTEGLPTMPTRTSWFTGRFTFPFRGWQRLEDGDVTLAEWLWARGFASALVTDVYHLHKPGINLMRGFDHVQFIRGQESDLLRYRWDDPDDVSDTAIDRHYKPRGDDSDRTWRPKNAQYLRNMALRQGEDDYTLAQTVRGGLDWLDRQVSRRRTDGLFLWLDCFDPHEPWDAPDEINRRFVDAGYLERGGLDLIDANGGPVDGYLTSDELQHLRNRYAAEVCFMDRWLGRLFDGVRQLGLMENSLIVWISDHGHPFGDHGVIKKAPAMPYEELAHVPLLIRHPDGLGAGQRFQSFTQPPDLFPTVLELAGLPAPAEPWGFTPAARRWDISAGVAKPLGDGTLLHGRSLLPLLRGDESDSLDPREHPERAFAYSGLHRQAWSVRTHEWSYIRRMRAGQPTGERALFHRLDDLREQRDQAGANPDVVQDLVTRLDGFVAGLK